MQKLLFIGVLICLIACGKQGKETLSTNQSHLSKVNEKHFCKMIEDHEKNLQAWFDYPEAFLEEYPNIRTTAKTCAAYLYAHKHRPQTDAIKDTLIQYLNSLGQQILDDYKRDTTLWNKWSLNLEQKAKRINGYRDELEACKENGSRHLFVVGEAILHDLVNHYYGSFSHLVGRCRWQESYFMLEQASRQEVEVGEQGKVTVNGFITTEDFPLFIDSISLLVNQQEVYRGVPFRVLDIAFPIHEDYNWSISTYHAHLGWKTMKTSILNPKTRY